MKNLISDLRLFLALFGRAVVVFGLLANLFLIQALQAQSCYPSPAGMVGWWKGDSDTVDVVSGNNGVLKNGAGFATGKVGPAFSFNGVNSYLEVPSSPAYNPANDVSMECWIWPQVQNSGRVIMGKWSDLGDYLSERSYVMYLNSLNVIGFGISDARSQDNGAFQTFEASGYPVPVNAWSHVAVVYSQITGTRRIYLNGVLVAQRTDAPITILSANTKFAIGARLSTSTSPVDFYAGYVDEPALYTSALSASDVAGIYNAGSAGKCLPPVAPQIATQPQSQTVSSGAVVTLTVTAVGSSPLGYQWLENGTNLIGANSANLNLGPVQPTAAGTYSVVVSNAFGTAVSSNAVLVVTVPTCVTAPGGLVAWWAAESNGLDSVGTNNGVLQNGTYVYGEAGLSFNFNGAGDYFEVPYSDSLNLTGSLTLEAWINPQPMGVGRIIFGRWSNIGDYAGKRSYNLYLDPTGKLGFSLCDFANQENAAFQILLAPAALSMNTWAHVAGVYDQASGTRSLYVNGVLVAQRTDPPFIVLSATTKLSIGARLASSSQATDFFTGRIDEASIYNRALSGAEIARIFGAGTAGKCHPTFSPAITSQPHDTTVNAGANATFTVTATGTATLAYQWLHGGLPISDATQTSLTISSAQPMDGGSYSVVVTNAVGSATSSVATLTVSVFPPTITTQPLSRSIPVGASVILSVAATGTSPLSFQWLADSTVMAGETNATLNLGVVQLSAAGSYSVLVSNPYGTVASSNAVITVTVPTCVTPPNGLVAWWSAENNVQDSAGTNQARLMNGAGFGPGEVGAAFSLNGSGAYVEVPYNDSLNLTGSMTLEAWINPQPMGIGRIILGRWSNIGDYAGKRSYNLYLDPTGRLGFSLCDVTNQENAAFQILLAPTALPMNTWAHVAGAYDQASGTRSLYVNGVLVAQRTDQPFTVLSASTKLSIGARLASSTQAVDFFAGRIDEASIYNHALSAVEIASLFNAGSLGKCRPLSPPVIVTQPGDKSVFAQSNTNLSVEVTGTIPMAYQWFFNGAPLAGATDYSLVLTNLSNAASGVYSVLVTNALGAITSSNANLVVNSPIPTILQQPQDLTLEQGASATFTANVLGAPSLVYQWYFGGSKIPGATSSVLNLASVQPLAAGLYSYIVTNKYGSVQSSNATLLVNPPTCAHIGTGLVAWWAGESNVVDGVSGNNGTLMGGAGFAVGEVGAGFRFNGVNQYAQIPPSSLWAFGTNDFSIELWANLTFSNSVQTLIASDAGALTFDKWILWVNQGQLQLTASSPTSGVVSLGTAAYPTTSGQWHHVAVTRQGNLFSFFVDGVLRSSVFMAFEFPNTGAPLSFGWSEGANHLNGKEDEISIYNMALSAIQIQSIYLAGSLGKCPLPSAPSVMVQPLSQSAASFTNVTLNVQVSGTAPLAYQWLFNGSPLADATGSSLVLSNVTLASAGNYSVTVTNDLGSVTSSNAVLNVIPPPTFIQAISIAATSAVVVVPINIAATGSENALGFSLNFDPTLLSYTGLVLADGLTNGSILINNNQVVSGRVGVAVTLPLSATFLAGTQQLVAVTFSVISATNAVSTPVSFGDVPTLRQVSNPQAVAIPVSLIGGLVSIPYLGWEGDVSPLPSGDGVVSIIDWVQVGRFVAGLDPITNAIVFQRADCSPRGTYGDGLLTVADWVQAGRYATGLDPLEITSGPDAPEGGLGLIRPVGGAGGKLDLNPRILRLVNASALAAHTVQVPVQLEAQGNENALGFSVGFDPAVFTLLNGGVALGSNAATATLVVNSNNAAKGQLGILLGLPLTSAFPKGTLEVLKLNFAVSSTGLANTNLSFASNPIRLQVTDGTPASLATTFQNGYVAVVPLAGPTIRASASPAGLVLTWPSAASGYVVETSSDLGSSNWTLVVLNPVASGTDVTVTIPFADQQHYYRLRHP